MTSEDMKAQLKYFESQLDANKSFILVSKFCEIVSVNILFLLAWVKLDNGKFKKQCLEHVASFYKHNNELITSLPFFRMIVQLLMQ